MKELMTIDEVIDHLILKEPLKAELRNRIYDNLFVEHEPHFIIRGKYSMLSTRSSLSELIDTTNILYDIRLDEVSLHFETVLDYFANTPLVSSDVFLKLKDDVIDNNIPF